MCKPQTLNESNDKWGDDYGYLPGKDVTGTVAEY